MAICFQQMSFHRASEVAWLVSKYNFFRLNWRLATCVISPPADISVCWHTCMKWRGENTGHRPSAVKKGTRSQYWDGPKLWPAQQTRITVTRENVSSEIRKILHLFRLPGHYFYWARDGTNGKIFVLKLNCMLGSRTQVKSDRRWELTRHSIPSFWGRVMVFWWFLSAPLYFETIRT